MEIDKKTIKALSADTRVNILKSLAERRKTMTELASEFNLSKPTVMEHLIKLEESGLVVKIDTDRKWIYYELSSKGEKLIKPKTPTPFVILLTLGIIIIVFGSMNLTIMTLQPYQYKTTETITRIVPAETVTGGASTRAAGNKTIENITIEETITKNETEYKEVRQINPLATGIIILGLAVTVFSAYKIKKKPQFNVR